MPEKKEVIKLLNSMADMLEFVGENQFKVSAFRNGANVLRGIEDDFDKLVKEKSLGNIKGIGKGLQAVIYEFYVKGSSSDYTELKKQVPDGIEELFEVRGIGAKKIKLLYDELGIKNLYDLEAACKANKITKVKGFTEAAQTKLLEQIDQLKSYSKFILIDEAEEICLKLSDILKNMKTVDKFEVSGEYRRKMEITSKIEFVVLTKDVKKFTNELKDAFNFEENNKTLTLQTREQIPVFLEVTGDEKEFTSSLFETTGSEQFLEKIKYNPSKHSGKNEEEIFTKLKHDFVIPEMREDQYFGIKKKDLKENSDLSFDDFKGLLHFHSTYSDGKNTMKEMFTKAKKYGMEYAAICDHSKSAAYANGLKEDRVLKQKEEIAKLKKEIGIEVFHGIESDILVDGSLDFDKDFFSNFDFVVTSVHSRFNLTKEEMTKRIIKAVENPNADLLGHPSGRLLLSRDAYLLDHQKIIDACAANKTAIEINANPKRLDLDWRWVYYAREKGCLFSINADAHLTTEFDYTRYGVMVGRKAGLKKEEVINCFSLKDFKNFLKRKVKRKV